MSSASSHLSIGEVLSLVQDDFPDVTISKIRFLESQGLIAPERTGSGFRKFYESDIERLRWILRQQGDHFLPLKVIKRMLEEGVDPTVGIETQPTLWSSSSAGEEASTNSAPEPQSPPTATSSDVGSSIDDRRSPSHPAVASSAAGRKAGRRDGAEVRTAAAVPGTAVDDDVAKDEPADREAVGVDRDDVESVNGGRGAEVADEGSERSDNPGEGRQANSDGGSHAAASARVTSHRTLSTPADIVAALQEDPRGRAGRRARAAAQTEPSSPPEVPPGPEQSGPGRPSVRTGAGSALISAEELCEQCQIEPALLESLEQFGLLSATPLGGRSAYDDAAVDVARLAARYASMGVEPRHLRMYKIAAEREAGFIEQMVVPLLKQRNPTARKSASDRCDELTGMGSELHAMILRQKLQRVLGS